ncbi:hypothetical protein [Mycobacterium sp.]|uniref:hypothetical protein n=1 Tax=Mycobacterium sp. TaxID=1785 RepID=UPI002B81FF7D|nr:hypothetical protein [Mycobacterium sp.]HTQ22507.1 hypothetical protein [Mycobacterium sp.]
MWSPRGVLLTLALASASALWPSPLAVASTPPAVVANPTRVAPGHTIQVHGLRFHPGETVAVQVCGDGGLIGAQGCALSSQATLDVTAYGQFSAAIRAMIPPSPCPCVLEVDAAQSGTYRIPLAIPGAPHAPLVPPAKALRPDVTVSHVHLSVHNAWRSWLGMSTTGTLDYTVTSTGTAPVDSATVIVGTHSWPSGDDTMPAPTVRTLRVGQVRSFRVPIQIGALTAGRITADGSVQLPLRSTTFSSSAFTFPWVLVVVVALLGYLLVGAARNRRRGRRTGPSAEAIRTQTSGPTPEATALEYNVGIDTILGAASKMDD